MFWITGQKFRHAPTFYDKYSLTFSDNPASNGATMAVLVNGSKREAPVAIRYVIWIAIACTAVK